MSQIDSGDPTPAEAWADRADVYKLAARTMQDVHGEAANFSVDEVLSVAEFFVAGEQEKWEQTFSELKESVLALVERRAEEEGEDEE